MRDLFPLIVAVISSGFLGCVTLDRVHYYAPDAGFGTKEKVVAYGHASIFLGPALARRITTPDAEFVIRLTQESVARSSKIVAFGPFILPVIPTIFNWGSTPESSPYLDIDLRARGRGDPLLWSWRESFVVSSTGHIYPVQDEDDELVVTLSPAEWTHGILRFPWSGEADEFVLVISGLSRDGETVPSIRIPFRKAKGWARGVIP